MDREPSGSGRDKSLSYRWWLSALEPMLSWQSGELLPSFLPPPSLTPTSLLPPSFLLLHLCPGLPEVPCPGHLGLCVPLLQILLLSGSLGP